MNETYAKLMMQQHLSEGAKATFHEKLKKGSAHRKVTPALRAALIAIFVCMLIPVTVLAVENIFGIVIINRVEKATVHEQSGIGLEIRFDNIKSRPVTDFSTHLQMIDNTSLVYYDNWEVAEADLGIDLLSNSICTDKETAQIDYCTDSGEQPGKSCEGMYRGVDGQLFSSRISAAYRRKQVKFVVSAKITTDHSSMTDAQLQEYHGTSIVYFQKYDPNVTTEQYTTKNGIPVTICAVALDGLTEYSAHFAVNNISYGVRIVGCEGVWDDAHVYAVLREILEGFAF